MRKSINDLYRLGIKAVGVASMGGNITLDSETGKVELLMDSIDFC